MSDSTDSGARPSADAPVVTVIGAGVMGTGIAQTVAVAGCAVRCVDRDEAQLARAAELLWEGRFGLRRAVGRGKLAAADAQAAGDRCRFTTDLADSVRDADIVLEAIPERLDAKLDLFATLGRLAGEQTVLASNTSGLSILAMGMVSGRPERVLGWHWSSPAQLRPFAEIVRSERTGEAAVDRIVALARRCGKNPVVITENPLVWGFVANRILMAGVAEARRVVAEGLATEEMVDTLVKDAFGWPAGPFEVVRGSTEGWGDDRQGSTAQSVSRPTHQTKEKT